MSRLGASPTATYRQKLSEQDAYRLLWRAGFGPKPGEVERFRKLSLDDAVASLTRPVGPMRLIGKPPHNDQGKPLQPLSVWGDDHCWWLDRMVRTNQPAIERMTLIWHSWFATSETSSSYKWILNQYRMLRRNALGNFHQLLLDVTIDPAMLLWLNGGDNNKYSPNENYGREMFELFTLGADRGYDQDDVHQNARALTGWTYDWSENASGPSNFRFDPSLHDDGIKRIFGQSGRFNWRDSCRLAVHNGAHASFFVNKLWNYFVGVEIPATTARKLERAYVHSGFEVRPIVEAILRHPLFYEGPRQVIPPVVWCAGMLRASRQTIVNNDWSWIGDITGQRLFQPPNVAGWNYKSWLDTARWAGRLNAADLAIDNRALGGSDYPDIKENASQALERALDFWGGRPVSEATREHLLSFGRAIIGGESARSAQVTYRQQRQNGLRLLIPTSPDWMTA